MSADGLYCEPATLDWSQPGGPRASDYGDVYYSAEDGLAETQAVFLQACNLPEAWRGRRQYTVGELGFGTGLNALGLWQLWREHRPADGWLDFISVEKHPLDREAAGLALAAWPHLAALAQRLLAQWPSRLKGPQRLVFADDRFAITIFQDEVEAALAQMAGPVDAWFLDGFAPDRNAAMWSQAVFDRIGALSAPGARVGTFTVAGFVRRGLAEAGFEVAKRPGFGRKRERLEAIWPGQARDSSCVLGAGPVAVLGAGIAGASLFHALRARGVETVLLDAHGPAAGASGAPAGLLTARLEKADRPHVRATLAAFDHACRVYAGRDGFWAEPVVRLPKDAREAERFEVLATWMPDHLTWDGQRLTLQGGGRLAPARLVRDLLDGQACQTGRVDRIDADDHAVRLSDASGTVLFEGAHLIMAAGAGAAAYHDDIAPSAGQVAVFAGDPPDAPVSWGHYACRAEAGVMVGATHVRGVAPLPDEDAEADFRAAMAARCPQMALGAVRERWSGVRASTPDRLPVLGMMEARVSILGGLGSRGFAHAPLLAEALVSRLCGGGAVLEADAWSVLSPQRFAERRARKGGG